MPARAGLRLARGSRPGRSSPSSSWSHRARKRAYCAPRHFSFVHLRRPIDENELAARVRAQIKGKCHGEDGRERWPESVELAVSDALAGLNNDRRYRDAHPRAGVRDPAGGHAPGQLRRRAKACAMRLPRSTLRSRATALWPVTASLGIAALEGGHASVARLLARAAAASRAPKKEGLNRRACRCPARRRGLRASF
jgi:GGDEF domain-containing protein